MQQEKKKLGHILIKKGILTPYTVARMLREARRRNKRLGCVLEEFGLVTSEELAAVLAHQFGLTLISNLENATYSQDVLQTIKEDFALEQIVFPLNVEGQMLHLAIADPTDMRVINNFAKNKGLLIKPYVASRKEIYAAISRHYHGVSGKKLGKTTILVVEDEELSRAKMRDMLAKQGYHVVTASDGMEGFRKVIAGKPQVVVTDNSMPKFDGFSLLKSIKANPEACRTPVVLVCDKLLEEDEARVFEVGFFDYIPKPFREVTLVSRVNRAVSSGETSIASAIAIETLRGKPEPAGRVDDVSLLRSKEENLSSCTQPAAELNSEPDRSESFVQEVINIPESVQPASVTSSALPKAGPSAAEQKAAPDQELPEKAKSACPSPADFIIVAPDVAKTPLRSQSTARQKVDDTSTSGESGKDMGSNGGTDSESTSAHAPASPAMPPMDKNETSPSTEIRTTSAATISASDFITFDETTVRADKNAEKTSLSLENGGRSRSRRIVLMTALVLVVIAGGGYLFRDQLHLQSLRPTEMLLQKVSEQAPALAGATKMSGLSRPVQQPLPGVQSSISQKLPSFVPVNHRDISFSSKRPGWERYVDTKADVRVFRQSGNIKVLQVLAEPGQVLTEASVKSAMRELTGIADFASPSRERQGKYLLQRSRIGQRGDVLLYRKIPSEEIVAFVVSLD